MFARRVTAQRGGPDDDVYERAILALAFTLDAGDPLAAAEAFHPAVVFLNLVRRHDGQRAADDVRRRPAEDRLGGGIPELHIPVQVDGPDGQRRGLDDSLAHLFGLAQFFVGGFQLGGAVADARFQLSFAGAQRGGLAHQKLGGLLQGAFQAGELVVAPDLMVNDAAGGHVVRLLYQPFDAADDAGSENEDA